MQSKISDEQLKQELDAGKSNAQIAKEFGLNVRSVERRRAKLARQGWSPDHDMVHEVPEGYHLKGTSTLYNDEGGVKLQWVKTNIDHERQLELMREAVDSMCEEIPRAIPKKFKGKVTNDDLLNCYIVTDYHLGLMAWHEETGEDWDMDIAENLIYNWFDKAIGIAPDSETGIFAQLGDFLHWDGLDAVTPTSKHIVDADTRFQKLVRVAIRVTRRIVEQLLTKHEKVILVQPGGNHDIASTLWLKELFAAMYEKEQRIVVDVNADKYTCYEHGLSSLFFHHGDKRKIKNVDHVFAAKYREIFGRTKYSYGHLGHFHSDEVLESSLMRVERHRTLAAPDAYAASGGWVSGRDAKVITYSKRFGEVSRLTISPEMVK